MSEKHSRHYQKRLQQLRDEAEGCLKLIPKAEPAVPRAASEILHELQMHQIELEIQNEELRQAHVALEVSRDRYVDLYELAPIGYLTISTNGQITDNNLKAATMLGVERNKLVPQRFAQFIADQDKGRWYHLFQRMKEDASGQERSLDLILIRADGSLFHAHLSCLRMGSTDEPQVLRVTLVDIAQLKQAEAELKITAIAFQSQEGMFITDANCVLLKVNQAFTNITGYSAEEAVGQTPRLFRSGRHDAAFYASMWEGIHRSGVWRGEVWNRRKNGDIYPQWLTITAVADNHGLVVNYVATLSDNSNWEQCEQQRLADESAHRDTLIREVHHRIKNNLQGVAGLLRNFAVRQPECSALISEAISQVQSIAVIHGLQGRAVQAKVRLCELISAIAANSESLWQIPIAVDIPPHWIPCRITEAEAVPLALTLNELITNAIKHGDQAKGVNIALRHEPLPFMLQVTITNTGQLPPGFDFHYPSTTGMGLQLIASLLPRKCANLSWEQQGDRVVARLELAPPIITLEQQEMEMA